MSYVIYQMPSSLWHKDSFFKSDSVVSRYDYLPVHQGQLPDDAQEMKSDIDILEHLFHTFNADHPKNYASRSMSSGDVVMLDKGYCAKYYLCCSVGWHELENF